jgi:hypothetical protein
MQSLLYNKGLSSSRSLLNTLVKVKNRVAMGGLAMDTWLIHTEV